MFDAGSKGKGLKAAEDIPAGFLVTEYIGEYVNMFWTSNGLDEAVAVPKLQHQQRTTFIDSIFWTWSSTWGLRLCR